jgi:hypothetical protein
MEFTGVMYLIIAIEVGSDVFQQVMMQDLAWPRSMIMIAVAFSSISSFIHLLGKLEYKLECNSPMVDQSFSRREHKIWGSTLLAIVTRRLNMLHVLRII